MLKLKFVCFRGRCHSRNGIRNVSRFASILFLEAGQGGHHQACPRRSGGGARVQRAPPSSRGREVYIYVQ